MEAKNLEILFKGMTRPAMLWGVPIYPLIIMLCLFSLISVWINLSIMLFSIPVFFIMKFIASQDDFMFSLLFQRMKMFTSKLNKKYYGVKTYSSMEYRKMSNLVDFPPISILGLNSNPSFEKFIPFSSLINDDVVLTKDFNFITSWEIKGIDFEVESNSNQDYYKNILANVFQAFASEPVSFYFHSSRHDTNINLDVEYGNSYLQDVNELYFKSFTKGSSKATNLYLTIIYNPFVNNLDKSKFQTLGENKKRNELLNYLVKFEDYINRLETNLNHFKAIRLKNYEIDGYSYSSQLEFYNYLLGGRFLKTRSLNAPLNEYLIGGLKNIQFAGDLVQLNYTTSDKKFAQIIEIKDYCFWYEWVYV